MPQLALNVSHIIIKLNGSNLPPNVMDYVTEVVVDQNAHLPDMFTIVIHDEFDRRNNIFPITDGTVFDLGDTVEIQSPGYSDELPTSDRPSLIKGEITALEPNFGEAMIAELVVRGYDKSHRLYRETITKTYLNMKDSQIAQELAGAAGLSPQVDETSEVHDHIFINNQSRLSYLLQRAWRLGYECYAKDGTFYFKKPDSVGSAQLTLTYGTELVSFYPRLTAAEQVTEVSVHGWDPKTKRAIVGKATKGNLDAQIKGYGKKGKDAAGTFGTSKKIIVDHPVASEAEATKIAEARMDEFSGAFVQAEGKAFRAPEIRAGKVVELKGLGDRFSGKYLVTSATHRWVGTEGFTTDFTVNGTRSGTFIDHLSEHDPVKRWNGVVTAIVTNVNDPDKWGRVKVKYPWLDESQESWWARTVNIGAGSSNAGFIAVPQVDDEVLVAFEQGDFNRPYIIGGLWNGKDKPPGASTDAGQKIHDVRVWRSRTGHYISMYDNADNKMEIVTARGVQIILDDKNKKLNINSTKGMELTVDDNSGDITIKGGNNISVESKMNMNFKANGDIEMKAGKNITLDAKLNMSMKGLQLAAEGKTKAELKGLTVTVQASTLTEVKGALVKIN